MATIYLDTPSYSPDSIIVNQATSLDGTQTEVVNAAFASFPQASGEVVIDSADISSSLYSFIYYETAGETSEALILTPADSLSITLQALFDKTILRLGIEPPVKDFISTVQHVLDFIDRRLHILKSDMIINDYATTLDEDEYQVALPSGFLGMDGFPYLSSDEFSRRMLTPLPDSKKGTYSSTGTPEHYRLRGSVLNLYPTCSAESTVNYSAFCKSFVDDLTDVVPYSGLFNETIVELVVKFGSNPMTIVEPVIEAMVYRAVDRAVTRRAPKDITFSQMVPGGGV